MAIKTEIKVKKKDLFREGLAHHDAGRFEEALACYRKSVQENPKHPAVWNNMGTILRDQGKFDASISCMKQAVALSPDNYNYLSNLGNALKDMDRIEEALEAHKKAAALQPDNARVRHNYGVTLREYARYEDALEQYEISCRLDPDNVKTRWDRAITYLHLGLFDKGWMAFEERWNLGEMTARQYKNKPLWQGEDLKDKTLLIHSEQGFGDTILASRYIPLVKECGAARIIVECRKPLYRLFGGIREIDAMAELVKSDRNFDYHVPMMSLPGIFGTRAETIPPVPKFNTSEKIPPEAKRLLDNAGDKFKVGMVWSGSVTFQGNRKRAVHPRKFLSLAECKDVQFFSLQKGPCEKDLAACAGNNIIWALGPHLNDFAETAAVINELDLIIMTDSSVAHLAGSMNKPVWNLLNFKPYWLYALERDSTPWYPSMRLFRQPGPADWKPVFEEVGRELEKAVQAKKQGKWPAFVEQQPARKKKAA